MIDIFAALFEPSPRALVKKVRTWEERLRGLTDGALASRTEAFRERLSRGESVAGLMPEAFACVVLAAERAIGMRHFDVQVQGGAELARGRIVEMKTGEGKTLVATLPVFLHALAGQGVQVVTVNDYLAARDAEWMGPVYELLGLSVGCIQERMGSSREQEVRLRRAAYACDVTYVTNSELVFDFLRDNLGLHPDEVVQRGFHFAVVDEVDLLLVDEAQTPLIISGPGRDDVALIRRADALVRVLGEGPDFTADHRTRTASLTDEGLAKIEARLAVGSLTDPRNLSWAHAVYQALQAHGLYRRDVEYIVEDGEIHIVDEHTGRVSPDKRYSNGLHQALEAKERVPVKSEDLTLAKTSYQYFFRAYPGLCGMTGTAWSEREELRKTYFRKVTRVPPNKPMIRRDFDRVVLVTLEEKHDAVVEEILEARALGRPVLVGTVSVAESERLSALLREQGVPHEVLNARHHAREAAIIAQAGRPSAVTISTNMAGRGTDIMLGERVAAAGGLHVIGTGEHESVRFDDQLRGRAGRQGDPGSSIFYVSLDDPVYQRFGQKKVLPALLERLSDHPDGEEVTDPAVTAALDELRRKVEVENQAVRQDVLKYDAVIHDRREAIWGWRRSLLHTQDPAEWKASARHLIADLLRRLEEDLDRELERADDEDRPLTAREKWGAILQRAEGWLTGLEDAGDPPAELEQAVDALHGRYLSRSGPAEDEGARIEWERVLLLDIIDTLWPQYLNDLERVEEGIWMRSYAERDPFVELRREAAVMYGQLMRDIQLHALRAWLSVEPFDAASRPGSAPATSPRQTRRTRRR